MARAPVVLITGASGFLATRLLPIGAERATIVATSRSRPAALPDGVGWHSVDLRHGGIVDQLVAEISPQSIIHAAAVNPQPGADFSVNVEVAAIIAGAAARHRARLVHVSSDIVHSGEAAPYGDDAEPDPINDYGHSKADAEASALASCPEAAVVRTSLIYGLETIDRGTAGFADKLANGERLSLWDDAMRQPAWIDALSDGLLRLALDIPEVNGPLNLAGEQTLSRAAFGRRMLEFWGVDTTNLELGSAADVVGQPLDLTMTFGRARSLDLTLDGVDEVVDRHV